MYSRDDLLKDLRSNVVEILFTKVNGEQRTMRCTLQERLLPESYVNSDDEKQQEKDFHSKNPDTLAVWDVQKAGWRSFRINSVQYCQIIDGY